MFVVCPHTKLTCLAPVVHWKLNVILYNCCVTVLNSTKNSLTKIACFFETLVPHKI